MRNQFYESVFTSDTEPSSVWRSASCLWLLLLPWNIRKTHSVGQKYSFMRN